MKELWYKYRYLLSIIDTIHYKFSITWYKSRTPIDKKKMSKGHPVFHCDRQVGAVHTFDLKMFVQIHLYRKKITEPNPRPY